MVYELMPFIRGSITAILTKQAGKSFLEKNYPEKAKEIYRALKREYGESMPAEVKARIALARAEGKKPGEPYSGPLHYTRRKGRYVKKSDWEQTMANLVKMASLLGEYFQAAGNGYER